MEVALLFLACALALLLALSLSFHLFLWVPYVPTADAVVRVMVEEARLQTGQQVFDLGAGDGRLLIAAQRACPGIRSTAVELRPSVLLQGWLRTRFSGAAVRWLWCDVRTVDVREADIIFLYLTPDLLKVLLPKLRRELRPGTRIVSHDFWWPEVTPDVVREVPANGRVHKVYVGSF